MHHVCQDQNTRVCCQDALLGVSVFVGVSLLQSWGQGGRQGRGLPPGGVVLQENLSAAALTFGEMTLLLAYPVSSQAAWG